MRRSPANRHSSFPARPVKPIAGSRANSSGACGAPMAFTSPGAAQTVRRVCPILVATSGESGNSPMRTAASTPSSTRSITRSSSSNSTSTAGYFSMNSLTQGPTCSRPNITGAVRRNLPRGSNRRAESAASPASTSARTRRQWSRYSRPSSVSAIRRVVRWISRTPSSASSAAIDRTTEGGDIPSACAAAVMLPLSATFRKTVIARNLSIVGN